MQKQSMQPILKRPKEVELEIRPIINLLFVIVMILNVQFGGKEMSPGCFAKYIQSKNIR